MDATVKNAEPTRTTEALSTIQDALGTFSTGFNTGNVSRSKNLRNGAAKINGTVLMPGEEFSAYTWLTPFTVENGYASAGSYANGQVVDTVGGGACQIARRSTMQRFWRRWISPAPESFDDCYLRSGIAGFGDRGYL